MCRPATAIASRLSPVGMVDTHVLAVLNEGMLCRRRAARVLWGNLTGTVTVRHTQLVCTTWACSSYRVIYIVRSHFHG